MTSFIILALVWLRSDKVPVLTGFLMVLPIVYANLMEGIASTDPQLLEMARLYRFGALRTLLHVYVPSARPRLRRVRGVDRPLLQGDGRGGGAGRAAQRYRHAGCTTRRFIWRRTRCSRGRWWSSASAWRWSGCSSSRCTRFRTAARRRGRRNMRGLVDVSKRYGGRAVLSHFSLSLPETGGVCLFGPSGCGKTTALRLLCGLETPDAGRVEGMAGHRIACQFQEDRLLPWYTVRKNLAPRLPGQGGSRGRVVVQGRPLGRGG